MSLTLLLEEQSLCVYEQEYKGDSHLAERKIYPTLSVVALH